MQPLSLLRKLWRNESGNAMVVCAATLPLVIGAAAIGVDTIQVSVAKRQLQRTADSAALAGAYALVQEEPVETSVNHDLAFNDDVALSAAPVIENAPTTGDYAGDIRAVRVVLAAERSVPFISFFMGSTMSVTVEATAAIVFQGKYCMVSLEEGNVTGISFSGSTSVNLGCGVVSNATSPNAVTADGSSTVIASPVAAVGGVPSSSSYASGTMLLPFSPPQSDPYSDLPTPTVPSGCNNQQYKILPQTPPPAFTPVAGTTNIYCYSGFDIKGPWTIPDGAIIFVNGDELEFGAQANVTGNGVTFILTSSTAATDPSSIATISMHGNAVLDITAPTSGTYEGVLIYQDRRAPFGESHINGNSASRFEGGFYFPSRQLTFNGNTGMQTECLQLVARRLVFSGNSSVQNDCPSEGGAEAFDATFVRLVS